MSLEERLTEAFLQGIRPHATEGDWDRIRRTLEGAGPAVTFAAAFARGVSRGAGRTLAENVRGVADLLESASNWTLEGVTVMTDLELLGQTIAAWISAPGTPERHRVLRAVADRVRVQHPATQEALSTFVEIAPLLEKLPGWLAQPAVLERLLEALAHELGDALGDEWGEIVAAAARPETLGERAGDPLGVVLMELALLLLGF